MFLDIIKNIKFWKFFTFILLKIEKKSLVKYIKIELNNFKMIYMNIIKLLKNYLTFKKRYCLMKYQQILIGENIKNN